MDLSSTPRMYQQGGIESRRYSDEISLQRGGKSPPGATISLVAIRQRRIFSHRGQVFKEEEKAATPHTRGRFLIALLFAESFEPGRAMSPWEDRGFPSKLRQGAEVLVGTAQYPSGGAAGRITSNVFDQENGFLDFGAVKRARHDLTHRITPLP
ncbi:MAG: hypothetical protein P8175_16970 [Deltaproteobacteria bacterium]